ncbi:type IV inositol polyphosphate 5-phosphatase 9-like isoform X3 [Miscanthus floridulus]|uniref:type IV inositol polyphosphate 5-phosphatase 9-like isoform X3 n=1 Tax=Miscanthus floridulus TaxID=154761 RepID=UPI003459998A
MGKSPRLAQMIWPRSAASRVLVGHQFVSELSGLEKTRMQGEQSETVKYRIFAGTWNVGGMAPPDDLSLEDWMDTKTDSYDIYVLGFQEMVPLNARSVLGPKQRRAAMKWQLLICDALNNRRHGDGAAAMHDQGGQGGLFRCLMSKQMVGIFVSVWTRSSLRRHVRHPGVSSVGAGVLGRLGNKGAVSVRFLLHGTSFCFVCCHLASGGEDGDALRRNADAAGILSRTSFVRSGGAPAAPDELPKKILGHDRVVLFGDLNYRIAMDDDDEARQLVRARNWSMLLENDELMLELSKGRQFDGWHEGHVTFAPTYKYRRNSDQFYWCAVDGVATGRPEKQHRHRAPAWCDRILWRGKGMKQVRYERCGGYRLSDHRPVRAVFHVVCELAEVVDG